MHVPSATISSFEIRRKLICPCDALHLTEIIHFLAFSSFDVQLARMTFLLLSYLVLKLGTQCPFLLITAEIDP